MYLLFLFVFLVADYHILLIFLKEKTRRNLLISLLGLISYTLFSKLIIIFLLPSNGNNHTSAAKALDSFQTILFVAFGSQLFAEMINLFTGWYQEHNRYNLHRQPISFIIEEQALLKKAATYFLFFASLLILSGIWLEN